MEQLYERFNELIKSAARNKEIFEHVDLVYLHGMLEKEEQMQVNKTNMNQKKHTMNKRNKHEFKTNKHEFKTNMNK